VVPILELISSVFSLPNENSDCHRKVKFIDGFCQHQNTRVHTCGSFIIVVTMAELEYMSGQDNGDAHDGHNNVDAINAMASKSSGIQHFSERHLLPILYVTVFLFLYGENIQPAPRTQIYERVICRSLHGDIESIISLDDICKAHDVQEELAFLKGIERLLGIFPSECSISLSSSFPLTFVT